MKILPYILLLSVVCPILADNEPNDLIKLRKAWEESIAKEIEKKNSIYIRELKKLQVKFMRAGDLAASNMVNAEIKKVLAAKEGSQERQPLAEFVRTAYAGIGGKDNIYEFELKEDVKGAIVRIWVNGGKVGDGNNHSSLGNIYVYIPEKERKLLDEWSPDKLQKADENKKNPRFNEAFLIEIDAKDFIKKAGDYKIMFQWSGGLHALRIEKVQIVER